MKSLKYKTYIPLGNLFGHIFLNVSMKINYFEGKILKNTSNKNMNMLFSQ